MRTALWLIHIIIPLGKMLKDVSLDILKGTEPAGCLRKYHQKLVVGKQKNLYSLFQVRNARSNIT